MSEEFELQQTKWTLTPKGEELFSERATDIEITDEAGGEYVKVTQHMTGCASIAIDRSEWPALRAAIDAAMKECR
jgi:uncharacterized membrane-anchored protein YhcB (DUF1043 family)